MSEMLNSRSAVLDQIVTCPLLVQHVWDSEHARSQNFIMKILNLGTRRDGEVQLLSLNCASKAWIKFQTLRQYIC